MADTHLVPLSILASAPVVGSPALFYNKDTVDIPTASDRLITEGVTFNNMRAALAWLYFGYSGMPQIEWLHVRDRYVIPMQHNIMNPITLDGNKDIPVNDTFIEFWIDEDERVTQDSRGKTTVKVDEIDHKYFSTSECIKLARVTVRFIGFAAEAWAKLFHHLTQRQDALDILNEYCNTELLEYVGPIRPINVDYFGAQNTAVAYDILIMLQYKEVIKLPGDRLGLISIAAGSIITSDS